MISTYYSKARDRALQRISQPRAGAWIVAVQPTQAELDSLAETYQLDRDNLADATDLFEAPRIEVDNGKVYIFTRYCYPEGTDIATEPLLIIHTDDHLITIMRNQSTVLDRLLQDKLEFITTQKTKTLMHILSEVNRSYEVQTTKISKRILQLRSRMRQSQLTTREFLSIIELEEDLNEFLSALIPQRLLLSTLVNGKYFRLFEEDRDFIEDIERSTVEIIELVKGRSHTLANMRDAYDAIVTSNLNATFKRLTSIAIFMTIPTIVSGLWGMNVKLPLERSPYALPILIGVITVIVVAGTWYFRRRKWL